MKETYPLSALNDHEYHPYVLSEEINLTWGLLDLLTFNIISNIDTVMIALPDMGYPLNSVYLSVLSRSISDHHLRCGVWLKQKGKTLGWALKTIYKNAKTHTYGPIIYMRALNSSVVLEKITEEGRLSTV